ncbi:hypothetical protein GALL_542430 [mine drainage metagenome]|uniref:Uncharacterized protein n=1 Tax=mine drainage metagenome TaxID=410659 RepID=A0A1J5P8S7_9ZZZZ
MRLKTRTQHLGRCQIHAVASPRGTRDPHQLPGLQSLCRIARKSRPVEHHHVVVHLDQSGADPAVTGTGYGHTGSAPLGGIGPGLQTPDHNRLTNHHGRRGIDTVQTGVGIHLNRHARHIKVAAADTCNLALGDGPDLNGIGRTQRRVSQVFHTLDTGHHAQTQIGRSGLYAVNLDTGQRVDKLDAIDDDTAKTRD